MENFAAIVLAAGKGTRMKSDTPKVLHRVCGRPMLYYPLRVLSSLGAKKVVTVVGHGADEVKSALGKDKAAGMPVTDFHLQKPQLGTGHAVGEGLKKLKGFKGDVLILSGDVPLITKETISALVKMHRRKSPRPALSLVSIILDDPFGYGRIIRDDSGGVTSIVEHKDLEALKRSINEVNAGIYVASADFLRSAIRRLKTDNKQGEYYLTDLVSIAVKRGEQVAALTHLEPGEVMGVNNRVELAAVNSRMRRKILSRLMLSGVTVLDPEATYVDSGVKVGKDAVIYPGVHLEGETVIGARCIIEEGVKVADSVVASGSHIKSGSVLEAARVGKGVVVGPYARLRPGTELKDNSHIGNFVEVKNSVIGRGSKANHLSYIGDSTIGSRVNIGAGTITCNYDGVRKWRTTIADGVFIGSDTQLVAPVKVGKGAYVGSGPTITKDVPPGSLALTRVEQKIIRGWAKKKMKGKK